MWTRACRLAAMTFILGMIALSFAVNSASAATYLVLRAPVTPHHHAMAGSPGFAQEVTAPGYSYGWFGVAPRQHAVRHFGVQRRYTEWKFQ